jgi:hypothetical protein
MRKFILLFLLFFIKAYSSFSQTAIDFTANDCAGISHHLFSELDAGKVVVVSFVEPCGSCIGPSLSAQSTVQGYATSNPGRVVFYVSDDVANTNCATLNSWCNTNGLGSSPIFSDVSFRESDYGVIAMPKIVVLAGTNHHVFFTQDNALSSSALQGAINTALATTSVSQTKNEGYALSVFPNPAKDRISLSYSLSQPAEVTIELYNIIGTKVFSITKGQMPAGTFEQLINFRSNFSNGIYFVQLHADGATATFRFVVDK